MHIAIETIDGHFAKKSFFLTNFIITYFSFLKFITLHFLGFAMFEIYLKCRIWSLQLLAFSTIFCSIKSDLSGNTVWPQASGFEKLAKMDNFWHFQFTFVHSKCKRSSLRSQHWMRLFLWFSNTWDRSSHFTVAPHQWWCHSQCQLKH